MSEKKQEVPEDFQRSVDEVIQSLGEWKEKQEQQADNIAALETRVDEQLHELEAKSKPNEALGEEIAEKLETINHLRDQFEEFRKKIDVPEGPFGGGEKYKTVADELWEEHAEFEDWFNRGAGISSLPPSGSMIFHLKGGFFKREQQAPEHKTTITSTAVGSATSGIIVPDRVRDYVPAAERRMTIRDLLPSRRCNSNAIEYPQESAFTNMTSPQVEGNAKDEAALTFTIGTANVRTFAVWVPATDQVLSDWGALRRIINDKLLYGLKLKEETQIVAGAGTGSYLSGLTTNATSYAGTYNVANDQAIDRVKWAKLEAEDDDEQPNFVLLHPADWNTILGIKAEEGGTANKGSYLYGNPGAPPMRAPILWGLTVIVTNSMTSGYFLVGDRNMAEVFDREMATIVVSTEHSDYFTKNMVAIRAEERIALAIYRTSAFIYGAHP